MSKDTIYRQDAMIAFDCSISGVPVESVKYVFEYADKMMSRINALPSAKPERNKGKWIYKNDLKQFFCSECGYPSLTYDDIYIYGMDLPNYCEDCGADMREGQDEQIC